MKLSSYLKSVFSIKNITLFSLTFLTLSYFYFSDYDWKNKILNAVTPITGYLSTNTTSGVTTSGTAVTSLISGGFVQGVNALFNTNANSYIAWAWKEDVDSGFEHIAYTGTGANRTIAHSLGETPAFMMVKRTDVTGGDWVVYHQSLVTPATQYLVMNSTALAATDVTIWNSTLPNSTTFSLGTNAAVNANGGSYIAYAFSEKNGYSKFGSYTGNNAADGPFVYTGFKPRYVLIKNYLNGTSWKVYDSARNSYNPFSNRISADTSAAEATAGGSEIDFLSNGFKLRTAGDGTINNNTLVYAAFAEIPFKESGTAYNTTIASSTRFSHTSSQYLSRTPSTTGNTKTFTYSTWTKRSLGTLPASTFHTIFGTFNGGGVNDALYFDSSDRLVWYSTNSGTFLISNNVYRDPAKWHHVVLTVDTTQAIPADRVKIFVDGVQITSFNTATYPSINGDTGRWNVSGIINMIGCDYVVNCNSYGYSGYMSYIHFVDGQALTPTSFGEYDTNGIWHPKAYTGTYGTNGFHLDFSDASNPGNDVGKGGVTISSLAFQPDLVWIKATSTTLDHAVFDSVQGVGKYLSSNLTAAVTSLTTTLKSFTSTGFTLGSAAITNTLSAGYVAWNWKESTTSGLDIVSYTGNGTSNRNIAHNLGTTPGYAIVKRTDGTGKWYVWHQNFTGATYFSTIENVSTAMTNTNSPWGTGNWSATDFMVTDNATNNLNSNGATYIAYIFAEKSGFSKFGTYTGNGSADGPFIYTGFKPKYFLQFRTNSSPEWGIYDNERLSYNPMDAYFYLDYSDAQASNGAYVTDFLSNGVKIRGTGGNLNTSSAPYAYIAFAEYPFKEAGTPYNLTIASSTRFEHTSSQYLTRTPATDGNRRTWTFSGWVKRSKLTFNAGGGQTTIFGGYDGATSLDTLHFVPGDNLEFYFNSSGGAGAHITTTAVYRDPAKWMHVTLAVDTTQATASDRIKLYVDGTQVTDFSAAVYPTLNSQTTRWNVGSVASFIGTLYQTVPNTRGFNGYMSDLNFVDGQALTPTSFGEYDTNGIWKPKTYAGAYGTNGFHLNMANASDPGNDVSGNNNDFTNNNIATTDNVIDSPTNNFAVGNAVDMGTNMVPSNGNLAITNTVTTNTKGRATVAVSSGKWYFESIPNLQNSAIDGICETTNSKSTTPGNDATSWSLFTHTGNKKNNGSSIAYGSSLTANTDVLMTAFDVDTGKIWWGKNGTWFASGDPASGTNEAFSNIPSNMLVAPCFVHSTTLNFGQGGQAGLTYDAASGGYFKYTPPAGFKALSTGNLPASAVTKSNDYFDVVTYTGTGSGNGFTNNNILTTDNVIDTPTNNFSVLSPLWKGPNAGLSNGNLSVVSTGGSPNYNIVYGTTPTQSGKYYFETKWNNAGFPGRSMGWRTVDGLVGATSPLSWTGAGDIPGAYSLGYYTGSQLYVRDNGVIDSSNAGSLASGDVQSVAIDFDAGKVWFRKNTDAWIGGGDPATGSNPTKTFTPGTMMVPYADLYRSSDDYDFYFGQGGFSGLTYNAASGGYFKYTPPTGFKAVSTAGMPASDITKPNDYFDAQTYTGTGAAATRSLFNFEPALLWIKDRTSANNHGIFSTFSTGVVSASLQMFFEI